MLLTSKLKSGVPLSGVALRPPGHSQSMEAARAINRPQLSSSLVLVADGHFLSADAP